MVYEFKFPDVGEGITEGELVEWKVKEGETVKTDQVLALVETDKAIVEIPSPKAGKILKLHVRAGETIKVGNVLVSFDVEETVADKKTKSEFSKTENSKEIPKQKPEIKIFEEKKLQQISVEKQIEQSSRPAGSGKVLAAPHTRKIARDMEIDINQVTGTGSNGKVTVEDLEAFKGGNKPPSALASVQYSSPLPTQTFAPTEIIIEGEVERIPIKSVRKKIAEHMLKSVHTAPHAVHMDEVDVTELVKVRKKEKKLAEANGIKLTYLPFIMKAVAAALKKHPYFNSSLDDAKQEIVLKKYYHLGVGVDTDSGLMVFVVRNVDKKSILEIAKEMQELSEKARNRTINLSDLKGSTFTITNIGSLGGVFSVPIINHPEVAILGVHKIKEQPVVKDGQIVVRQMLNFSLSFDHRVVDGAQAARFLNEVMMHLEDPDLMLIDVV